MLLIFRRSVSGNQLVSVHIMKEESMRHNLRNRRMQRKRKEKMTREQTDDD